MFKLAEGFKTMIHLNNFHQTYLIAVYALVSPETPAGER